MPCYRCGTRQADPEAGKPSPWKRGVLAEHQVLICPDCFTEAVPELDRCVRCGSARLIRRLDQVECLDCRHSREAAMEHSREAATEPPPSAAAVSPGTLADEVARALDRVLGRG